MENVLFTRSSTPSNEPIVDGQLIFDTSGTGKMYLDNGTDRLEMGGAMNVDSTLSKTSTNPIQNKAVAGVMLENLTDIDTVTASGFLTDALATKELHTEVNEINSNLTFPNGEGFYPDEKDGVKGYNTSPERGADTFFPFKSGFSGSYNANAYYAPFDESSAQVFTIDVSNFKTLTINITIIDNCYFLIQKDGVSQPVTTSTGTITYDVSDCNTVSILYYRSGSSNYPYVNYTYTVS